MANSQSVDKTTYMWLSLSKGYQPDQESVVVLKEGPLVIFFSFFSACNVRRLSEKVVLEVTLVSSTFRARTVS